MSRGKYVFYKYFYFVRVGIDLCQDLSLRLDTSLYTASRLINIIKEKFGGGRKMPKAKQLVTWIAAVIMLLLFLKVFVLRC